jgi:hypothetical protein
VIRKYVLALSILSLPLGLVAFGTTTANASVRPHTTVTMTGSISCKIVGKITATPGLKLTTPQTVKIVLSVTASGCTGNTSQGGATVKSGKVSGTITGSYSCESLLSSVPNPSGTIKWTSSTTTKIAPTDFALSNGTIVSTAPPTITYSSTQTGSYAGSGSTTAVVKQSENALITACSSSTGLTKLTIKSGSIS